jgi:hypothetical protein
VVRCQVLECEPPSRLAYSWSAGPIIDTQVIYRLGPDGDARASLSTPASTCRSPGANRHSEEPSLVGRECSSGFPAWSGALRGVKTAKSETSVQKFKSRQQWLSQPLAGFAVTNQSGWQDTVSHLLQRFGQTAIPLVSQCASIAVRVVAFRRAKGRKTLSPSSRRARGKLA